MRKKYILKGLAGPSPIFLVPASRLSLLEQLLEVNHKTIVVACSEQEDDHFLQLGWWN